MPWSEFCLLQTYFKTKLAAEVIDNKGQTISPSRIILYNIKQQCSAKDGARDVEDLILYVSNSSSVDVVDVEMTKKTYEMLYYLWDNDLDGSLGKVFQNKVEQLSLSLSLPLSLSLRFRVTSVFFYVFVFCRICIFRSQV